METSQGIKIQDVEGLRVVRGPNWKWGNQDAGEGYVGTVVKFKKNPYAQFTGLPGFSSYVGLGSEDSKVLGVVRVIWDCGIKNDYRIGHEGAFDLRVVDNSATGSKHIFISCIQCCADSDIIGIRWHCEKCEGSICSSCFFRDKHDQTHTNFKRYDTPNTDPFDVVLDPTKKSKRVELKGIFKTARVKKGHDWENGNEDTADGVTGVGWVMESRNQAPGMVQVKWQNGDTYPYRLGADGKVDLQLVKVASGGFYHPEHLPVLKTSFMNSVTNSDGEVKFAVGDRVQIFIDDEEKLKKFQDGHGGYVSDIKNYIGKPGSVRSLNEVGVIVLYENGNFFNLNPEILLRLSYFSKDQPVRIKDNETTILAMEKKFGSIVARRQLAGETGRVVNTTEDKDYVEVILDSDKKNELKVLHRDWVEILRGDPQVTIGMTRIKSTIISVFVQAAASGQHNTVKEILTKYPINVDAKNNSGQTAMHSAARYGHLEIIQDLYFKAKEKGLAVLEQQDGHGRQSIHHAAEGCHWKVLAFLIKPEDDPDSKGADLNVKDHWGLTALQIAIRVGCWQSVKLLIENGSDINSQDSDGDTALHNAIIIEKQFYRDEQIILALTSSNRINLKLKNKRGLNPLLLSVAVKNRVAFNYLLKAGGEELANQIENQFKFTTIHLVCFNGELQFAKDFLKHIKTFKNKEIKSYVEKKCKNGFTPLLLAVFQGHYGLVELLVEEFQANVKVEDDDGDNPFNIAAIRLEKLMEPDPKTSPAIFKIHTELKEKHPDTLICYPGLSLMCYLISKGCPWRKTRIGRAKAIINNELIRIVLESYVPLVEESTDAWDEVSDEGCIFCPDGLSVFKTIEECGHVTNVACSRCFHSRLQKCPTCRKQIKSSYDQSPPSVSDSLLEEAIDNLFPSSDYSKQFPNNNGSLNVAGKGGTQHVQQTSTEYDCDDPGPSTSGYKASKSYDYQNYKPSTYQQPCPASTNQDSNWTLYQPQQASMFNPTSNLSREQYNPGLFQTNNYQSVGNNLNIYNNNFDGQNNLEENLPNMMAIDDCWNIPNSQAVAIPEASTQKSSTGNSVTLPTTTVALKYIECKRMEEGDRPILIYDDNRYSVQRRGKNTITWQCTKNANEKRNKCPATIIEENNQKYRIGARDHCHYKPERNAKKRRVEQQENGSRNSLTSTQEM